MIAILIAALLVAREPDEQPFTTLVVEYETGGTMSERMGGATRRTLFVDRAGDRSAQHSESSMGRSLDVRIGRWRYSIDVEERTGTKQWMSRTLLSMQPGVVTEALLAESGAEKVGTDEIAGLTCDRWERRDQVSTTTMWVWNGVSMGDEMKMGQMETRTRVLRVAVDEPIPEEHFRVADVRLSEVSFVGAELLRALESGAEPAGERTFDRSTLPAGERPFEWPGVEPFRSSRLWEPILENGGVLDVDRIVTLVGIRLGSVAEAEAGLAELFPKETTDEPSALLEPLVPLADAVWWVVVPRMVTALGPLHAAPTWTDEQLETARLAARFLAVQPFAPRLSFEGDESARRAELEVLGRWFRAQLERPALYAAMICTADDGPFAGLPHEGEELLPAAGSVDLDGTRKLRLCELDDAFVLQCVDGEELAWSRRLSLSPKGRIGHARLLERPPDRLGPYGWKVHLVISWEFGEEYAHLYLDRNADLLFYFVGW